MLEVRQYSLFDVLIKNVSEANDYIAAYMLELMLRKRFKEEVTLAREIRVSYDVACIIRSFSACIPGINEGLVGCIRRVYGECSKVYGEDKAIAAICTKELVSLLYKEKASDDKIADFIAQVSEDIQAEEKAAPEATPEEDAEHQ